MGGRGKPFAADFRDRPAQTRPLQLIAALVACAAAAAQDAKPAVPPRDADTSALILAPAPSAHAPTATAPNADRPAASEMSTAISGGLPAFIPHPSAPQTAAAIESRVSDKPRNQIPRLPPEMMQKYVVHEPRVPVFRRRDLYTTAGLIDLGFKEHPGLRIGNLFNLNANAAYQKIIGEELFADRQEVVDTTVTMAIAGDPEEMKLMQQAILDEAFMSWSHDGPVGIR